MSHDAADADAPREPPAALAGRDLPDVAGLPTLLRAVAYKKVILLARYPVNTLSRLLGIYLFFAVVFFGGKAAASGVAGGGAALAATFDGLIVGWFLWTMSIVAYFSLAGNVTREAQWGTLEQLFMSPYGFGTVMTTKVVVNLLESLVWGGALLALMLATTRRPLHVDLLTVVPVAVLALLSVVGIGFVFAGLAILYKRIENVQQLVQFVLIALIAAPAAEPDLQWLRYLPLAQGSAMLQSAMREGTRLWEFPAADLALLIAVAAGYTALGYYLFQRAQRRARRQGLLGEY